MKLFVPKTQVFVWNQNYFYKNNGDLTFQKTSDEWGFSKNTVSNAAAYGDLDELNAWLRTEVVTWAQGAMHPERRDLTVWEVFQAERPTLIAMAQPFDGFFHQFDLVKRIDIDRVDARAHRIVTGTAKQIADSLEEWFTTSAADGFVAAGFAALAQRSRNSANTRPH